MITVTLMTATGPHEVKHPDAVEAKLTDRGVLQLYNARREVIAAFGAWAYWIDDHADKGQIVQ